MSVLVSSQSARTARIRVLGCWVALEQARMELNPEPSVYRAA